MYIAPSMLACDFSDIKNEVIKINNADMIHLDVMDGHFVPNISFGPDIIKAMKKFSNLFFDTHLMITNPLRYIQDYANAGSDNITFHIECDDDINKTIEKIHSLGLKASLAIKPKTNIEQVYPYLDKLYMVLIMTVEPGFGGQKFMQDMMQKVKTLKQKIRKNNLKTLIEVDGGINKEIIGLASSAGVDICVAGTSVFKAKDPKKTIEEFKNI